MKALVATPHISRRYYYGYFDKPWKSSNLLRWPRWWDVETTDVSQECWLFTTKWYGSGSVIHNKSRSLGVQSSTRKTGLQHNTPLQRKHPMHLSLLQQKSQNPEDFKLDGMHPGFSPCSVPHQVVSFPTNAPCSSGREPQTSLSQD